MGPPPPIELEGRRVELLELGVARYGVLLDGVRVPLRVRHHIHERALLSGVDESRETTNEGMEVAIAHPFSNGVRMLAFAMTAPSTREGGRIRFARPHVGPGPSSTPTIATNLTIEIRDGVVVLDLDEDYLDDSAY